MEKNTRHITQHIRYGLTPLALGDIAPFGCNVVYAGTDGMEIRAAFGAGFARSVSVPSGRGGCGPSDGLVRSLCSRTSPIFGGLRDR